MQQTSKVAQDEIFSSLRAWQELGRVLLLVSRKYQEALLFLLCSYNSFIGLWRAFFYWIMTWGRSMRDSLQTAQTAKLMQIVPGHACTCCSNVQPSTASYAGCVQQQSMNGALHAGVLCPQLWKLLHHPQRGQSASCGKLVPAFIHVCSFEDVTSKFNAEIILLGGRRIPLGVWVLPTSYSFILRSSAFSYAFHCISWFISAYVLFNPDWNEKKW